MAPLEPQLRVMTPDEAPSVLTLMQKIGWHHPLEQTRQNITWGGQGSFCLAFGDELVATTIALKYSQRLAWIGLVISSPDYQRRGFARRLMNHAMDYLKDVDSIMLDASVLGFPLYDSMGYQSLYKVHVYQGTPQQLTVSIPIRKMTLEDLPHVIDMDAVIMGLPRSQVINWLFETGNGYVATDSSKITGYMFTRAQLDPMRLVAWNALDVDTAEALFHFGSNLSAEGNFASLQVTIPEPNETARQMVERYGLKIDRSVTRMVYGKQPPGAMTSQFGIIAFMTG